MRILLNIMQNKFSSSSSFSFSLLGVATARQYSPFHSIYFVSLPRLQPYPCLFSPNPFTFSLAFLFSFCLALPSPSSFSPCSLFFSFLCVHTNVALHSAVCLRSLQFSQSLSRIRFLSCPFLSLPMPISPFSALQLPFFPPVFPSPPPFPFHKAWLV